MYIPKEILISEEVLNHPLTKHIVSTSPKAIHSIIKCDENISDLELLANHSKLYNSGSSNTERKKLCKDILYLHSSKSQLATMASGENQKKRCHNFLKITPYRASCIFNCEYCWFMEPDLVTRINVTYFDNLETLDKVIKQSKPGIDTVFTFTHYKTDCLVLEHMTGYAKKTVDYFSNKENAYVILLTKSNLVQPLLDLNHNQHTIVQWSMNNEEFIKLYEHGTASMISRLKAAKFVQEAGYPVTFRVDPIFATKGWKQHYSKMIEKIYEYIKPDHITFAVAKFQGPEEIKQIIANSYGHDSKLLNQELGKFEFAKANYSSDYLKSENSFPGTMPDMPFTYPDQLRYELLSHMIKTTRKYDFDLRIGVCEESADMWGELGLPYSNNKNLDCACNYTGFAT